MLAKAGQFSLALKPWRNCDTCVADFKRKWQIEDSEIHTAWLLRQIVEQTKIQDFEKLPASKRRSEVAYLRNQALLKAQQSGNKKAYAQLSKNYRNTDKYTHLTLTERQNLALEFSKIIGNWGYARLFAECVDKAHFFSQGLTWNPEEQAFQQIVSRFEGYLQIISSGQQNNCRGLLIHDNNETVANKFTNMMLRFHKGGTLWRDVSNIIETPLFVDSKLTSMVQVADFCAYALRRYLENNEETLLSNIFSRADRKDGKVVGVRHYTRPKCGCKICQSRLPHK